MGYLNLVILGMMLYGIYIFSVKIFSKHIPSILMLFVVSVMILPLVPFYLFYEKTQIAMNAFLLYSCLFSLIGAIGIILFYRAIATGPISIVSPIWGLHILLPTILGIVLLKEPITLEKLAGMILACLAIVLLSR